MFKLPMTSLECCAWWARWDSANPLATPMAGGEFDHAVTIPKTNRSQSIWISSTNTSQFKTREKGYEREILSFDNPVDACSGKVASGCNVQFRCVVM